MVYVSRFLILHNIKRTSPRLVGGLVVRRCWINFQYRGVLLIWIIVGQGHIVLVIGAGGVFGHFFLSSFFFSFLSPSLGDGPI